jgi:hypothetical protein
VYIAGNLIIRRGNYNSYTIRSFIYILVDILNRLNQGVNFDINIRAELLK